MIKMYKHESEDVWKAINVDKNKLFEKLKTVSTECVLKENKPSEKIEKMSKQFNKAELSAIIMMMEYRIANLKERKHNEVNVSYQ